MTELQNTLPSGWECRYDGISGKIYYINHYTKTTTWEDPRVRPGISRIQMMSDYRVHSVQSEHIPLQEMRTNSRMSPLHVRTSRIQDSTLTNTSDTDESVVKISSMFPTVSDTHIRLLLKKYMKSIFPKAEETLILDILSNNDNNIQKTSDALKQMGYERKDPAKVLQQQAEAKLEEQRARELEQARAETPSILKIKTTEEKTAIKLALQEKYKDIAERVIIIALDSVQYDENRANQILQIMVQEDNKAQCSSSEDSQREDEEVMEIVEIDGVAPSTVTTSQSRQSLKSLLKSEKPDSNKEKGSFSRVIEEVDNMSSSYKSPNLSNTHGANPVLAMGANDKLLLTDYVSWQGADPNNHKGSQQGLAKGPNKTNLTERTYASKGPNPELCKGPVRGLAKGSIFQQLRYAVGGESRGK